MRMIQTHLQISSSNLPATKASPDMAGAGKSAKSIALPTGIKKLGQGRKSSGAGRAATGYDSDRCGSGGGRVGGAGRLSGAENVPHGSLTLLPDTRIKVRACVCDGALDLLVSPLLEKKPLTYVLSYSNDILHLLVHIPPLPSSLPLRLKTPTQRARMHSSPQGHEDEGQAVVLISSQQVRMQIGSALRALNAQGYGERGEGERICVYTSVFMVCMRVCVRESVCVCVCVQAPAAF